MLNRHYNKLILLPIEVQFQVGCQFDDQVLITKENLQLFVTKLTSFTDYSDDSKTDSSLPNKDKYYNGDAIYDDLSDQILSRKGNLTSDILTS